VYCTLTEVFLTPTEVFTVLFFLSCKANARVKLVKTGRGPHSSKLVVICVVRLLFVLFYVLFVCKCLLPPGDNPTAVNKYITSCLPKRFGHPCFSSYKHLSTLPLLALWTHYHTPWLVVCPLMSVRYLATRPNCHKHTTTHMAKLRLLYLASPGHAW
jgi:hypothetical protein